MRAAMAIVLAYGATAAAVPLLFVGMATVWPVPVPRGLLFASGFEIWLGMAVMALVAGLPGFAVGRLALWWTANTSFAAFALAGAGAGFGAAVLLCLPNHLWVLRAHDVGLFGAGLGAVAGLVYRQIERWVAGMPSIRGNRREAKGFSG
jgi:hypothetical protein